MKSLRDISILFLRGMELRNPSLLDCTSATGIRGIRYAEEAAISNVLFLDVNPKAARNSKANLKRNKIKAKVLNIDIQEFANGYKDAFDVIDLDPFGSPAPYIYDLLKISKDGTILMITATDTAVLCGAHSSACVKQYGSLPLHNELCKEVGLRILINHLIRKAAEFNFGVKPLLSISDMHYMRTFIRLEKGAKQAYASMIQTGFGRYCKGCSYFDFSKGITPKFLGNCINCKEKMQQFGSLFLGTLNDKALLGKMLKMETKEKATKKLLTLLYDEYDTPFFYSLPRITRHIGISSVPYERICQKLAKEGYAFSRTQFDKDGIKTNATVDKLTKAVRAAKVE